MATEPNTEPNTSASSSSILKNKTTTNLVEVWNFEITLYARFEFMPSHIKQIASFGIISAVDVEQSLIELSYDFDKNVLPIIKTSKINFLMGLLRTGHAYVSEAFRGEQEAIILEMAREAEARPKNLLEAKFEAWEANLSNEDKKEMERQPPITGPVEEHPELLSNLVYSIRRPSCLIAQ